jgi:V8-like Glu-specific endopeptidase
VRERIAFERELLDLGEAMPRQRETFGENSLQSVRDSTAVPFRWICQVVATMANGQISTGTGFLVGPRHVLTCAHVIYPQDPDDARPYRTKSIMVYPARHGAREPYSGHTANGWAVHPLWRQRGEPDCTYDYGLIRLKQGVLPGALGFWGSNNAATFARTDPAQIMGRRAFSAGYAFSRGVNEFAARVMRGSEGSVTGSAVFQRCNGDQFRGQMFPNVQANSRVLSHDVDTLKGQSGGPLWIVDANGVLRCIGIHQGHLQPPRGNGFNVGLRLTSEMERQVRQWIDRFLERRHA